MKAYSIRQKSRKIFILAIIFLVISISLCGYVAHMVSKIDECAELNNNLSELHITVNKATVSIKEFLLNAYTDEEFVKTGSNSSFENFNSELKNAFVILKFLKNSTNTILINHQNEISVLEVSLTSYQANVNKLAFLYKEKGFKDLGIEGEMRKVVHNIENYQAGINKELLLTLRRHEKDFLLRKDEKYLEKFSTDFIKLNDWITPNKNYKPEQKREIQELLETYKSHFFAIVEIEKSIGLKPSLGIRNQINYDYSQFSKALSTISVVTKKRQEQLSSSAWMLNMALIMLFVILTYAVVWSIIYFSKQIAKPIEQLNDAADEIAKGHLSVDMFDLKNKTMVADIVKSYEKLILKLRETITQIEDISARKINSEIPLNSKQDEIGQSLNKIINEISAYDEAENQRKWAAEGMAIFAEIIRKNHLLETLCQQITTELVKYLKANQAGFFLLEKNQEKQLLILKASYAYERKKYLEKSFDLGEGLIGQCFFEKDIIFLSDIPQDYLNITSGLGFANPNCILIVPFMLNDEVFAVFEIASFKLFKDFEIEFLRKIGEMVASSISSVKMASETKLLLENSLTQTEMLKAQEEEMRQNMEELSATQEEMQRNQAEYIEKIALLEKELQDSKMLKTSTAE
jgi:methyl-accepting chemotaxis protein